MLLLPSGVKFRDEPIVTYGVEGNVMLYLESRNFNSENVAGAFTTSYADDKSKTICDLNFAQSRFQRESNFCYISSYGIATSTANVENNFHRQFPESRNDKQTYFLPQINQSYKSTKLQLFRNSSSAVSDPNCCSASCVNAVANYIHPTAETFSSQSFLWYLQKHCLHKLEIFVTDSQRKKKLAFYKTKFQTYKCDTKDN